MAQSDDFHNNFDIFIDDSGGSDGPTDEGVGSTKSRLSIPHATNFLGSSSIPRSTLADDIFMSQAHGHQGQLNEDGSETIDRSLHYPGSSLYPPGNTELPGEGLSSNYEWDHSAQPHNYTFNQSWPASGHYSNNVSGFQGMASGLDPFMPNDFSNPASLTVDHPFVSVSQNPMYFPSQDAFAPRRGFTPLIEDQNVLWHMPTCPSIATRAMSANDAPNMSPQEINSVYPNALNTFVDLLEGTPLNFGPGPHGLTANANLANISPPTSNPWPSNPVAPSFYENSPSSTSQLVPTLPQSSGISERSENGSGSTELTNLGYSRRRKILPIQAATSKSQPATPHTSKGLAYQQHDYGPREARPRHSDRRKLTPEEKENARKVREKCACLPCLMKKLKCDEKTICRICQETALAKNLAATHICMRGGILVFRQGIPDIYDTNGRLGLLPKTLRGSWRTIIIGDRVASNGTESSIRAFFPKKVPLTVRVREYETCDIDSTIVWSEGSTRSAVTAYAIDRSKLPTAQQLDEWGRNLMLEYSEVPDFRPYVMDSFLFAYRNTKPILRQHHLVDLTIRLVSLSTWLFEAHPTMSFDNVHNSSFPLFDIHDARIERRLSDCARSQLLLIAAPEFEATEKEILSIVDSVMKPYGCDPQDALILGLCLRRMALLYRLFFKRYKKFVIDVKINRKREKHKAMYDALTTAYSLVYRGSKSPHSKRWREEDSLSSLGYNVELKDLFIKARDYDRQYCEDNRDDEDDAHLKMLFLERGPGGGPRT